MVAKTTNEHFAEYSANTRIKHQILKRYLQAYVTALSRTVDAFHYIDGFAGRGVYADTAPGSPILALDLLSQQKLPYCASFVEAQKADADLLRSAVASAPAKGSALDQPLVLTGEFSVHIDTLLTRDALQRFGKVATFAFVDPCRVKGVRVRDIQRILDMPFGECLVFWNYDGVNRWLGAVSSGNSTGEGLKDLFGDTSVLQEALALVEAVTDSADKERELLSLMLKVLRYQSGARFVLPFRFEARDANRTSHYLIHCSRHAHAFKLMKDVMSSLTSAEDPGTFEFLRKADVASQADMFIPSTEAVATQKVLDELRYGPRPLKVFLEDWVRRPADFFSQSDYRRLLLTMEERGQIQVLDADQATLRPRNQRRLNKGKATLAEHLWVRRSQG